MSNNNHSPADVLAVITAGGPLQFVKTANAPGKLSDAEFAKLSPAERLDYCRTHDQRQFQPPPSPR